jgi:uncharacterized membrane protein
MAKTGTTRPTKPEQGETRQHRFALERLVFFSDAVFAIAITILVLDLRLPAGAASAGGRELFSALAGLWPAYLAFFISFWVIGLSWISHHRKFLHIRRADNPLLMLNLLLLMVIVFIPFPTAVMSESAGLTATAFYASVMILASLAGMILWLYAVRARLVDPGLDDRAIRREISVHWATMGIFALSIVLAVLDTGLARLCWLSVFVVVFFLRRRAAGPPRPVPAGPAAGGG